MDAADIAALILRLTVGVTILLHGWNHAFGGGKLPGTAGWFESMGLFPGRLHALLATGNEIGAGVLLILGLFTPLAAGAVLGTMVVAFIAHHRRNGFFIFRPGEGYEYVVVLAAVSLAIGALGGGAYSLDDVVGLHPGPGLGLALSAVVGFGGGAALLATFWRPSRIPAQAPTN